MGNRLKVIAFDLGGTLMQYNGMPLTWVDFYSQGLCTVATKYGKKISPEIFKASVDVLKEFNPRVNYREKEYSPEYIFKKVFENWDLNSSLQECIETFWEGLNLKAEIYDDVISVIKMLKQKGYIIATLTDLPNAMPDYIFKKHIDDLLNHFDFYVSSSVAGYRKPNFAGLKLIAERYSLLVSELIFVGDEEKDRQTAINAGCRFIKIDRKEENDECINCLSELLNIL